MNKNSVLIAVGGALLAIWIAALVLVAVPASVSANPQVTIITDAVRSQTTEMVVGSHSLVALEIICSRLDAKLYWTQLLVVPGGVVFDPDSWCQENGYPTVYSVGALLYSDETDWSVPIGVMEKEWGDSQKYETYTHSRGVVSPYGNKFFDADWIAVPPALMDDVTK